MIARLLRVIVPRILGNRQAARLAGLVVLALLGAFALRAWVIEIQATAVAAAAAEREIAAQAAQIEALELELDRALERARVHRAHSARLEAQAAASAATVSELQNLGGLDVPLDDAARDAVRRVLGRSP